MISSWYFSYSVMEIELLCEWFHWYQWPYYMFRVMASYWSTWLIGDLEGGYVGDLRIWVDCILSLDYSIHAIISLFILNIMIYLGNLTDYTWNLPDNCIIHVVIVVGTTTTLSCYTCYISCYIGILIIHVDVVIITLIKLSSDLRNLYIK